MKIVGERLVLLVAKIVDGILINGKNARIEKFTVNFNDVYKLGSVFYGPEKLFFVVWQLSIAKIIHLQKIVKKSFMRWKPYPLSQLHWSDVDKEKNEVDLSEFMFINSSLRLLEITASPFCSFYYSDLPQKHSAKKIFALFDKTNQLRQLEKLRTPAAYSVPAQSSFSVSVFILLTVDDRPIIDNCAQLRRFYLLPQRTIFPFIF